MTLEERVARIEDRDAIRETIANYVHGLDKGNRELFVSLWTDDARYLVDPPFGGFEGIEAIGGAWEGFQLAFFEMHHYTTNTVIDGPHGDAASAVSDVLVMGTDSEGTAWTSACVYHDRFRRVGDGWRFEQRHIQIDYMVPWHSPQGLVDESRVYIDPPFAERLVAMGVSRSD